MAEVDSLEIGLQANAKKANDSIETLITKLGILASALGSVNSSQLGTLAMNVNNLGASMKSINDVGTASFTRLAKNITKIASVDSSALNTVASSLNSTASAFNQFTAVSENAAQIGEVAKNISKLGNKSVQTSITNMPQLATSLTNLLTTLASAPTVSNNVIQMTNALANLASQGSRAGSASRTIQRSLNGVQRSAQTATKSTWSLAKAFGKFYASYFMVVRGIKGLWTSIESTTDYIEAFNYYAVAFGKIGSEWGKDFEKYGYDNATDYANSFSDRVSTLLGKLSGLQVDVEGGLLTADGAKNLGLNIQEVTEFASQLASVTNSLGQTGETTTAVAKSMTMLAGDISSLFNIDYTSVATNIQSGLIGQSRALYKYGIDITNATLQTYAYNLGVEKSISEMTQMEKQQLRVLAILDQSKVSWGDLSNTINSPSNMIRQFNTNVKETGMVLGQIFIPVLQKVMPVVNGVTIAIKRMLVSFATLMGVKIDFDAFGQNGYQDTTDGLEDMAGGYDDVAEAAKNAQKGVRGFDELENRTTGTSKSGTSAGTGDTIDLTDQIVKATEEYEKVWNEAFSNMQNKAEEWADKIQVFFKRMFNPLKSWADKVDWKKIKDGFGSVWNFAKNFTSGVGSGFITFLGGLADIGAPAVNIFADAISYLFKALGTIPPTTLEAIGGGLGGIFLVLTTYKLTTAIGAGIKAVLGSTASGLGGLVKLALAHPFVTLAAGLGAIFGAIYVTEKNKEAREEISILGDTLKNLKDNYNDAIQALDSKELEIKTSFENADEDIANIDLLWRKYELLAENEELTAEQQQVLKQYAEELVGYIPELNDMLDQETGRFTAQKDEIEKVINKQKELYRVQAAEEAAKEYIKLQIEAEVDKAKLQEELEGYKKTIDKEIKPWLEALQSGVPLEGAIYDPRTEEYQAMYDKMGIINKRVIELNDEIATYDEKIQGYEGEINRYMSVAGEHSTTIANTAKSSLDSIQNNTQKTLEKFKETAYGLGGETARGYGNAIGGGTSMYVKPKLSAISATVRDALNLSEYAKGKGENITENYGISLGAGNTRFITPKLSSITDSIKSAFDVSSEAETAGENTAKGFETGLSNIGSKIASTASNLANNVVGIFKSVLDIHSPSRVMFELGAYTTEGFKDGMESLYDATQLSAKDFGFGVVEAVHPQQLYSDYMSSTPTVSPMASTTTQNYYNSNTSVDNAETNALLREQNQLLQRILAKEYGITKDDIGKASRDYARDYFRRTGRDAYTF